MENVTQSFLLTLVTGLTMCLGSVMSFIVPSTNKRIVSLSMSFSAGIMIYIAFMEMLPEGLHLIEGYLGEDYTYIGQIWFFGGMFLTAILEKATHVFAGDIHSHGHGHTHSHSHGVESAHLTSLGLFSALAIGIHNIPEGLALFTTGLQDISLAYPVAAAIIMHNIPLGMAISFPLYYSTKSRLKAFTYTSIVGLMQPLGAVLGYLVLYNNLNDLVFGIVYCVAAGIMIFVSLDELLPEALRVEDHHISVYGAIIGMIVMAIALNVFGGHAH